MIAKTCRDNLLAIAAAYGKAEGLSLDQVSKRFYGIGHFLREFRAGTKSVSLQKFDTMIEAFRDEWPENARWPFTHAITIQGPSTRKVKNSTPKPVGPKSNRVPPAHERAEIPR